MPFIGTKGNDVTAEGKPIVSMKDTKTNEDQAALIDYLATVTRFFDIWTHCRGL